MRVLKWISPCARGVHTTGGAVAGGLDGRTAERQLLVLVLL